MPRRTTTDTVHQLEVTLEDVEPPVWRRIEVPSSITLAGLHTVIQSGDGVAGLPPPPVRDRGHGLRRLTTASGGGHRLSTRTARGSATWRPRARCSATSTTSVTRGSTASGSSQVAAPAAGIDLPALCRRRAGVPARGLWRGMGLHRAARCPGRSPARATRGAARMGGGIVRPRRVPPRGGERSAAPGVSRPDPVRPSAPRLVTGLHGAQHRQLS